MESVVWSERAANTAPARGQHGAQATRVRLLEGHDGGVISLAWAAGGAVEFAPNVQALDPSKYGRLDLAKQLGIKGSAAAFKDGVVIEVGCSSELSAPPAI